MIIQKDKSQDFTAQAWEVLKQMQKRDYKMLDLQMDCAKDDTNLKDLTFGRLALSIPEDHYEVLTMIMPDLQHPDAEVKTKAWKAFTFMEESLPYKPNAKMRTL